MQRILIRYSELYYCRKMAMEWLQDIDTILSNHSKWYQTKLPKEKRNGLESDQMKLLEIISKIDKHFLDNADLVNFQCDPDYILPE